MQGPEHGGSPVGGWLVQPAPLVALGVGVLCHRLIDLRLVLPRDALDDDCTTLRGLCRVQLAQEPVEVVFAGALVERVVAMDAHPLVADVLRDRAGPVVAFDEKHGPVTDAIKDRPRGVCLTLPAVTREGNQRTLSPVTL